MNMAGSVLVDTNVVVAYFRGDKVVHPHFAGLTPLFLPWVVLGELHFAPIEHNGGRSNSHIYTIF